MAAAEALPSGIALADRVLRVQWRRDIRWVEWLAAFAFAGSFVLPPLYVASAGLWALALALGLLAVCMPFAALALQKWVNITELRWDDAQLVLVHGPMRWPRAAEGWQLARAELRGIGLQVGLNPDVHAEDVPAHAETVMVNGAPIARVRIEHVQVLLLTPGAPRVVAQLASLAEADAVATALARALAVRHGGVAAVK
jgi:hypothetical protein